MQTHNPFGSERWTNKNLTTNESTLLNWVGKEKDHESKLGNHGVRKYEYETGRFISIDPLWGNYYGWTPYQYSMNSPVMLVDVGGEKVQGIGEAGRDEIRASVESKYEKFVQFNSDGMVDAEILRANLPANLDVNSNAHTLMRLAEHPDLVTVSVQAVVPFKDVWGNVKSMPFLTGKDFDPKNIIGGGGITVLPQGFDALVDNKFSLDGNTNIYITPGSKTRGENTAHEMFYHFRFYLMGKPSNHKTNDQPEWYKKYEKQSQE